jgi:hypothetical protein
MIPKDRLGVTSDWDKMGQERGDRGTFTFHNVLIEKDEILAPHHLPNSAFATLTGIIAQLTKTYVGLGIGQGALQAIEQETLRQPNLTSTVDSVALDPYILGNYGDVWIELKTAIRLADDVAEYLQVAWEKGFQLTHEERQDVANAVFSAEVYATRVGLMITNCMFEVMGNSPTVSNSRFERYWQNLRTFGVCQCPGMVYPKLGLSLISTTTDSLLKALWVSVIVSIHKPVSVTYSSSERFSSRLLASAELNSFNRIDCKMKLCIVTHNVIPNDGQGRLNYEIIREACQHGHQVTVVSSQLAPELQHNSQVNWISIPVKGLPTQLVREVVLSSAVRIGCVNIVESLTW